MKPSAVLCLFPIIAIANRFDRFKSHHARISQIQTKTAGNKANIYDLLTQEQIINGISPFKLPQNTALRRVRSNRRTMQNNALRKAQRKYQVQDFRSKQFLGKYNLDLYSSNIMSYLSK